MEASGQYLCETGEEGDEIEDAYTRSFDFICDVFVS